MDASRVILLPVFLAALALIITGVAKLISPQATYVALRLTGLPNGRGVVWFLAAVEIVVGVGAILRPRPLTAAALALLYLGFTGFLFRARRVGASCGCLTESDSPPGALHIALDVVAAAAGVAAVFLI